MKWTKRRLCSSSKRIRRNAIYQKQWEESLQEAIETIFKWKFFSSWPTRIMSCFTFGSHLINIEGFIVWNKSGEESTWYSLIFYYLFHTHRKYFLPMDYLDHFIVLWLNLHRFGPIGTYASLNGNMSLWILLLRQHHCLCLRVCHESNFFSRLLYVKPKCFIHFQIVRFEIFFNPNKDKSSCCDSGLFSLSKSFAR